MRRAFLSLVYEGKDISRDIGPDLISFTFTDKSGSGDETDDVQVTISDRDRLWQGPWLPERGHVLRPVLRCEHWFAPADSLFLDCGSFEVDEIEFEAGETDRVTIKAVPSAVKSSLTGQKKTRAWNAATLEQIAGDLASAAGLGLVYRGEPAFLGRVDQRQEADLAFLSRVAREQGFRVKAADGKLVVFSGLQADALEPVTLTRGAGNSFRAKVVTAEVYAACVVTFTDPASSKTFRYEYRPDNAPKTGKVLSVNQRVGSVAQAQRVARARLREKNAGQLSAEWSGMGDPRLRAGATVALSGFGRFDAAYSVKEATHTLTRDGYATSASLETALKY